MEDFKLHKVPVSRMFMIQYGQILGIEIGLIICNNFIDMNFYIFQLLLLPVFLLLLISRYNKSVTTILIDVKNEIISLNLNSYLLYNKNFQIPFNDVVIQLKWKWLLNYYSQVIEISDADKIIAVIPLKGSIWNEDELNNFIQRLKVLKEENKIKAKLI